MPSHTAISILFLSPCHNLFVSRLYWLCLDHMGVENTASCPPFQSTALFSGNILGGRKTFSRQREKLFEWLVGGRGKGSCLNPDSEEFLIATLPCLLLLLLLTDWLIASHHISLGYVITNIESLVTVIKQIEDFSRSTCDWTRANFIVCSRSLFSSPSSLNIFFPSGVAVLPFFRYSNSNHEFSSFSLAISNHPWSPIIHSFSVLLSYFWDTPLSFWGCLSFIFLASTLRS